MTGPCCAVTDPTALSPEPVEMDSQAAAQSAVGCAKKDGLSRFSPG